MMLRFESCVSKYVLPSDVYPRFKPRLSLLLFVTFLLMVPGGGIVSLFPSSPPPVSFSTPLTFGYKDNLCGQCGGVCGVCMWGGGYCTVDHGSCTEYALMFTLLFIGSCSSFLFPKPLTDPFNCVTRLCDTTKTRFVQMLWVNSPLIPKQ